MALCSSVCCVLPVPWWLAHTGAPGRSGPFVRLSACVPVFAPASRVLARRLVDPLRTADLEGVHPSLPRSAVKRSNRIFCRADIDADVTASSRAAHTPGKKCSQCEHVKKLEDFEQSVQSEDGRAELCRACVAKFRAKRSGRPLHHLDMSVEEAWKNGKVCAKCAEFKEIRDYCRRSSMMDGVDYYCRGCRAAFQQSRPERAPQVTQQTCTSCGEMKAASEYNAHSRYRTGLYPKCRDCTKIELAERAKMVRRSSMYIPRKEKLCSSCKKVKPTTDFNKDSLRMDGYQTYCRVCIVEKRKVKLAESKAETGFF